MEEDQTRQHEHVDRQDAPVAEVDWSNPASVDQLREHDQSHVEPKSRVGQKPENRRLFVFGLYE